MKKNEGLTREDLYAEIEILKMENKSLAGELQVAQSKLTEREKELSCHQSISTLINSPGLSIDEVLAGTVEMLPPSWQFPELTSAEVVVGDKKFRTNNFLRSEYQLKRDISIEGEVIGFIAVYFLGELKDRQQEAFLPEEETLLTAITELIDIYLLKEKKKKIIELEKGKYQNLVENMNDLVYDVSLDGIIRYVSPYVEHVLGYQPEELIGKAFFECVYPEDLPSILELYKKTDNRESRQLEYRFLTKEGTPMWVRSTAGLNYADGKPVGRSGLLYDINEQKLVEFRLKESEEKFRTIVESINEVIYEVDLTGKIIYASKSTKQVLSYEQEEVLGLNIFEFVYPEDIPMVKHSLAHLESRDFKYLEYRYRAKDGSIRWVRSATAPIYRDGKFAGGTGVLSDITDRKIGEQKLEASEASFRNLVENINEAIFETDDQGVISYISPQIQTILGYLPSEMIGQSMFHFVGDNAEFLQQRFSLVQKELSIRNDYELYSKCGEKHWVQLSSNAVFDGDKFKGVFGTVVDITEKRQALDNLTQSESRYRSFFEGNSSIMFLIDPDTGRINDANLAACQFYGWSKEEICRMTTLDINILPKEEVKEIMKKVKTGEKKSFVSKQRLANGEIRDVEVFSSPVTVGDKSYLHSLVHDISDRKKAEEQLLKLSLAVEQSPVSIVITNLEGNIEYVNPKGCETTGYSKEELIGQNPRVLKSGETSEKEYEYLWNSISSGNIWRGIFHNKRKSGEYYWESAQITPIRNGANELLGYFAVKEDISERKEMQEALMKSDDRFRQVTGQSQTVIWEVDADGLYTYISTAATDVWCYDPDELVGKKHFYDLHPEEGQKEFKKAAMAVFEAKGTFTKLENLIVDGKGGQRWMLTNGVPIIDGDGSLLGYRGSDMDITDMKDAQKALHESENRFKQVAEQNQSVIWETNTEGFYTYVSPVVRTVWGYEPEDLIGKMRFWDIHPEKGREKFIRHCFNDIQNLNSFRDMKSPIQHKDRKVFWMVTNGKPVFDSSGNFRGYRGSSSDITESRRAEKALKESENMLNYAQELAGMGSWEFNVVTNDVKWSQNYYKLLELTEEDRKVSFDYFSEKVHPEDLNLLENELEVLLKTKQPASLEHRLLMDDGRVKWVENRIVPEFDSHGNLRILKGINLDITEKKLAEAELLKRQKELSDAQRMAKICSWEFDYLTEGNKWSENTYELYQIGREVSPSYEYLLNNRIHPDDIRLFVGTNEAIQKSPNTIIFDFRVVLPDGEIRWMTNEIIPVFKEDQLVGLKGINQDITEKKEAELAIRMQHEKLDAVINAIPDLIFIIDEHGTYLEFYVSDELELLIRPDEIIGSSLFDTFPKEEAEMHINYFKECMHSKQVVEYEYSIALGDSHQFYEARITLIEQNKVLVLSRNITASKLQNLELKRLSLAVTQSPVITVITDLKANIEYANPAFEKITGYHFDEVKGKNVRILQSGSTDNQLYRDLWATIKKGKVWHGEWMNKKKNGELYWEDVQITPIMDDNQKIINYLAVKQDISKKKAAEQEIVALNANLEQKVVERTNQLAESNTKLLSEIEVRKLAEEALSKSEEKYRSVVENIKEVIFITDEDGHWTFLNSAWTDITGFMIDESIGQLFVNYVHPEDRAKNWELFEPLIQRKKEYCRHEIRYLTKDGDFRWIEVFARLVETDAGHIAGTYGTLQDITERKMAEDALKWSQSLLQMMSNSSPLGFLVVDSRTDEILYFNHRFCEIWEIEALEERMNRGELKNNDIIPYCIPVLTDVDAFAESCVPLQDEENRVVLVDEIPFKGNRTVSRYTTQIRSTNDEYYGRFYIFEEITERKRNEEFEEELLQLSTKLTGISYNEIDDALDMALARIGQFLLADRSYIFEFDQNQKAMSNTHEWCNDGISAEIDNLQDIPSEIFPNWMETLYRHENIIIPAVANLPESWAAERAILEPQGIQSILVIPLLVENSLIGFVGLDSVISKKTYSGAEVNSLKVWSSMLASLINNKRTESLLAQTRQNYQTFFNSIEEFLIVLDNYGNIIHANETLYNQLGYAPEEILNKPMLEIRPPERRKEALEVFKKMISGESNFCALPYLTKSGAQIEVETHINKGIWDGEERYFAVSKDISQMKLSEEKFSLAFHGNPSMMAISHFNNGQYLDFNQAFIDMVGYSRDELANQTNIKLGLFPDPNLRKQITEMLNSKIPVHRMEMQFRTKKGEIRTGLLSADSFYIGKEKYLLTVTIDVSERIKAQEEMRKARQEAEKANAAKSEFLSRMSHELRTPMNSILGFAQLLEMGELNPGQLKGVNHIMKSGKHLLDLINEVLDISRIEAGRLSLSIEPVSVTNIVREAMDVVRPYAVNQNISMEFINHGIRELFVRSDKQRLKQILLNLINNAIKYNRVGGSIVISAEVVPSLESDVDKIRISVIDSGHGIAPEDLGKLFNPFERIGAEKTGAEGTGLGLAVVKRLVDAMNGKVGIESKLGEGSTFWIEFPAVKMDLREQLLPESFVNPESQLSNKRGVILYIEDNSSNVELVEQILINKRPAINLITNMFGEKAVGLAEEYLPNLILLDLNLPDKHGLEVLRDLKNNDRTKHISVVIISADAMPDQQKRALKEGAEKYLTKPLDVIDFLEVLDKCLK